MRARLAAMVAAAAAVLALAIAPVHHAGAALAEPHCTNGTNWDNVIHVCK
jgi:hypothetical protein